MQYHLVINVPIDSKGHRLSAEEKKRLADEFIALLNSKENARAIYLMLDRQALAPDRAISGYIKP